MTKQFLLIGCAIFMLLPWNSYAQHAQQERRHQGQSSSSWAEHQEKQRRKRQRHHQERDNNNNNDYSSSSSSSSSFNYTEFQEQTELVSNMIFPSKKNRPRHIIKGIGIGMKSLVIGSILGLTSILIWPSMVILEGFQTTTTTSSTGEEDDDGSNVTGSSVRNGGVDWNKMILACIGSIFTGIFIGIPSVVICGIHAIYNIVIGTIATPFTIAATLAGMVWDNPNQQWMYYNINDEYEQITNYGRNNNEQPIDMTLYQLLNVTHYATSKEIKRAYYTKAKDIHPDKNLLKNQEDATTLFLKVHDAYQILSDPNQRANYDEWGISSTSSTSTSSSSNFDIEFDPRTFFIILFGSPQVVEQYTGELGISSLIDQLVQLIRLVNSSLNNNDNNNESSTDIPIPAIFKMIQKLLYHQPQKRQVEIAMNLIDQLSTYELSSKSTTKMMEFQKLIQQQVQQIYDTPFGNEFITIIGTSLQLEGQIYFTQLGFWNTLLLGGFTTKGISAPIRKNIQKRVHQKELVEKLWTLIKSSEIMFKEASKRSSSSNAQQQQPTLTEDDMLQLLPEILDVAWAYNTLDISHTLSGACRRLFTDGSISRKERKRRAHGLLLVAEEFLKQVQPQQSNKMDSTTTTTSKMKDMKDMAARVSVAAHAAQRKSQGDDITKDSEEMIKAQQETIKRKKRRRAS